MFDFLGRGKNRADKAAADTGPSTMPQAMQLSATKLEMVRMTLHGVLKMNGIPASWIAGEVIPIHIPGQGEALLIQLEVMHWHDALVLHAPILQHELLAGLKRFDQQADKARYLISWKFPPDCGCPRTKMPDPTSWSDPATVTLGPVSVHPVQPNAHAGPANVSFELPPVAAEDDDDDQGFAATQIHDIRP